MNTEDNITNLGGNSPEENYLNEEIETNVHEEGLDELNTDSMEEDESDADESLDVNNNIEVVDSQGNFIAQDVGNLVNVQFGLDKRQKITCPECGGETRLTTEKIICTGTSCDYERYRNGEEFSEFDLRNFINEKDSRVYRNTIANITNYLIEARFKRKRGNKVKLYKSAHKASKKAAYLAPAEPTSWGYMALCEYLQDPESTIKQRARNVLANLEKAKTHGMKDEKFTQLSKEIAYDLFTNVKKINDNIKPSRENSEQFWTTAHISNSIIYLNAFVSCYEIYSDVRYLEEALKEISKDYKYLITEIGTGELKNLPQCGSFNAVRRRQELINRIYRHYETFQPDFEFTPPEIARERFRIIPELEDETSDERRFRIVALT